MSETTTEVAPDEASQGDEHVTRYEEAGLEEGGKPVPKWYILVAILLGIFFVAYIATYLTGVQPNTAR
jgi:hypothetical protein